MIDGDTYISWEENPISWETVRNIDKKTGQGTSLEHDFSTQKTFYMNVQNVGENKMFVRLRLANLETMCIMKL